MPLFETIKIDKELVASIVKENWNGIVLGKCLKESQNHTFLGEKQEDTSDTPIKYIIRVTPDPKGLRIDSTELEVELLKYLAKNDLSVCDAIPNKDNKLMLVVDGLIINVFKFARGSEVNYIEWKWLNKQVVNDLGKWFGNLHKLTRQFSIDYPELASKARMWDTLHDSILKGVELNESDKELVSNPQYFNIIHGDVNPSNYYWSLENGICMFDWDQVQKCFLLYDLSAPIFGVWVLENKGSPIDGKILPEFNSQQYTDYLLETYETTLNEKVDRAALSRCVDIRKQLYIRFCKAAINELDSSSPMYQFCKDMNDFFKKQGL